ncbi:MAG TPA: PfkB family carbohydrate kinase [Candidatus Brocadiia bacterium]|nr:PfkB family carbohydrate kinase [Candidatus Brocadiia bacterium]
MITAGRLEELLGLFKKTRMAVFGDYFLDRYWFIDKRLAEISLETDLEAHQVARKLLSPGAAGTVLSNVAALGAGKLHAVGMIGRDGEGFELRNGVRNLGADDAQLLEIPGIFTPTYTKPMVFKSETDIPAEINRVDIKNRKPIPRDVEDQLIAGLRKIAPECNALLISDQVQEDNCGAVTDRVREELGAIARECPNLKMIVDSRLRIGRFPKGIRLKPNQSEAFRGAGMTMPERPSRAEVEKAGKALTARTGTTVFITCGTRGLLVIEPDGKAESVPGVIVPPPIDIVGAGDSVMAGIAISLASGATPAEAAAIGNMVASVTVTKIGQTGTASHAELRERIRQIESGRLELRGWQDQ